MVEFPKIFSGRKPEHPRYSSYEEAFAAREEAFKKLEEIDKERSKLHEQYVDRAEHIEAYRKKSLEMVFWETELLSCENQMHELLSKNN